MIQLNLTHRQVVELLKLFGTVSSEPANPLLIAIWQELNQRLRNFIRSYEFRKLICDYPEFRILMELFIMYSDDMPLSTEVVDNIIDALMPYDLYGNLEVDCDVEL